MDKTIVVGVSGGIAAYKVPELVRGLTKKGAHVHVIMTRHAQKFVTPLTFQTVSNNPVITEMFSPIATPDVAHVSLADKADMIVIAPATANVIAKFAIGIADDFLTTTVLATRAPVLVAPAMNVNMYENPATQHNIQVLQERGYLFVGPGEGGLACGWEGRGRMSEPEEILAFIESVRKPQDFVGHKMLITAGPTREAIDPVRYISNYSSGKMGYALAQAAVERGAAVVLVTGPTNLVYPRGVEVIAVQSALEMFDACMERYRSMDTVIMAAAVGDFRPTEVAATKIKKNGDPLTLTLEKNPDILAAIGKEKNSTLLVGFAAETDDLLANAEKKLKSKKVDLMVANDVTKPGAGFDSDTNIVTLLTPDGKAEELPQMTKEEVAHKILDKILQLKP